MAAAAIGSRRKCVLGRYELEREISSDFVGRLWSARIRSGPNAGHLVGIRRITETDTFCGKAIDEMAEAAFWAMDLDVSHLTAVTDVVRDRQELGVVFAPLSGSTVRSIVRTAAANARPVLEGVATRMAMDFAIQYSALAGADDANHRYVYGGVTPDSLFIDRQGRARLLDLGVAPVAARYALARRHVGGGCYFAPEQLEGASTVRTDVFGMGLVVWELLAIRRPRHATTFKELAEKIRARGIPDLSRLVRPGAGPVNQRTADVIARAVDPSPARRFANPMEFAEALASVAEPVTHAEAALLLGLGRASGIRRIALPEASNNSTSSPSTARNSYRDPLDTVPYEPEEWLGGEAPPEHSRDTMRDTLPTIDVDLSDFDSGRLAGDKR